MIIKTDSNNKGYVKVTTSNSNDSLLDESGIAEHVSTNALSKFLFAVIGNKARLVMACCLKMVHKPSHFNIDTHLQIIKIVSLNYLVEQEKKNLAA